MLPVLRLRHALLLAAGLGCALSPALLSAGCGPAAVGIEACRKIESARCEAAASCGFSKEDVDNCKLLYQDQCLHGIENAAHRPTEVEVNACVAAVKAAGACAAQGVADMSACPAAPVLAEAAAKTPCEVVTTLADELQACAFAASPSDAGTSTDTTTTTTTSTGGGGAGGSTGTGGTGGSTSTSTGGTGGTTSTSTGGTGGVGGNTK